MVGIVQSAFGNIAEFALTILALRANLPEVVRIAIAGSILGNARAARRRSPGCCRTIRGRPQPRPCCFDRRLFSGIATLSVIAVVPMAHPELRRATC